MFMFMLDMQEMEMKMKRHGHHQKIRRSPCKNNKKGVKVVYISTPMKVKTSASKFRDLVQELTGKDSDAAERFSDPYGLEKSSCPPHEESNIGDDQYLMMRRSSESPTFSDAVMEPIDDHHDVFRSYREGSFLRMLSSSNLLSDSFQIDHHHAFKSFIN